MLLKTKTNKTNDLSLSTNQPVCFEIIHILVLSLARSQFLLITLVRVCVCVNCAARVWVCDAMRVISGGF